MLAKNQPRLTDPNPKPTPAWLGGEFMQLLKQKMFNECGVEVINMAIELDVKIPDAKLAKALASAAVANSDLERQTIEAGIVQVKA
jgi:hypothetical protein